MKKIIPLIVCVTFMIATPSCTQQVQKIQKKENPAKDLSQFSQATFASGCFWCVEGVFESVIGVEEVISGYAGGNEPNPTYQQVSSHTTDHAEAIQVYYDSTLVSYATLLKVYFGSQDPTQVNGQGPDNGASYRSIIFYKSLDEKSQAEKYISEIQEKYVKRIAAELLPFKKFWQAEDYHQDYIQNNPGAQYVIVESIPRIKRFQKQFPELIKAERRY